MAALLLFFLHGDDFFGGSGSGKAFLQSGLRFSISKFSALVKHSRSDLVQLLFTSFCLLPFALCLSSLLLLQYFSYKAKPTYFQTEWRATSVLPASLGLVGVAEEFCHQLRHRCLYFPRSKGRIDTLVIVFGFRSI